MIVEIMDYKGKKGSVEVNLDNVLRMDIHVVTGDEILEVTYKDGEKDMFDSSFSRWMDFPDYSYTLYKEGTPKEENLLFDDGFINRTSTYFYG